MAAVTICSDFGAQKDKSLILFPLLPHLFPMKWWDRMPWSSFSEVMLGWRKHKLESRLLGEISINLRYADDTTLMAESEEELKSLLMKVKEESEKFGLKLNI